MLIRKNATANFATKEAGGKGYNLYLMANLGLPVPAWVVLGRSHFLAFTKKSGIAAPLEQILQDFASGQTTAAAAAAGIER